METTTCTHQPHRIADSGECADCGEFPAPRCECGAPAVNSIWNGMFDMPVCGPCWQDPDAIATEVTTAFAEARLIDPRSAHLTTCLRDAMVRRGRFTPDPVLHAHVVTRWHEWFPGEPHTFTRLPAPVLS